MWTPSVWAPAAERVALVVGDGDTGTHALAMTCGEGGWWRAATGLAPGTRYAFALEGGPPRPDPRSASQPDGVDGLSAVVDHHAFPWTDQAWRGIALAGSVLYELHVGTFTPEGTFDAAITRLAHLVELGIDAIEVMPVAEFSGARGWGYDGVDLFAPHHAYGGPDGFKRLVDACHAAGIGVVLDVVYNHLGPAGNYLPELGPYFSDRHTTGWGAAVNLDGPGSDEVRRFVIDNALMWLRDYHCDGLRLDAVHALVDDSAVHILEQLANEVRSLGAHVRRPLFLIAESDRNDPQFVRGRDAGGYGIDTAWADDWHHAVHTALTGESDGYYEDYGGVAVLAKALRQAWVFDGTWSRHRNRRHGRSPAGLDGTRFVVCTQNHDQIGNRARGDRSSALMSDARLRIAAALLCTTPFVPMLFQGEEWGATTPFQYFTDHHDPALAAAVRDGRRQEFAAFGWDPQQVPDPQDAATFTRSKLDWDELHRAPHADLLTWYRTLIALRRARPELSDPRPEHVAVHVDEHAGWLVVERRAIAVAVNLGVADMTIEAAAAPAILAASDARIVVHDGTVVLPPDSAVIMEPA